MQLYKEYQNFLKAVIIYTLYVLFDIVVFNSRNTQSRKATSEKEGSEFDIASKS